MTAQRERIFAAIEQALRNIVPAIAEIERMPSSDPATYPALHIHDRGQSQAESEARMTRYQLELVIEGFVEGTGGADAHQKLNALHASVIRALFAGYDAAPLGGTAENIEEGGLDVSTATLAKSRRLAFAQEFTITFATQRGDPDQA